MSVCKDETGNRYGRLTVIEMVGGKAHCQCDCGTVLIVLRYRLHSGHTKSCGCYSRDVTRARATRHGHSRITGRSPEYRSWVGMLDRCRAPGNPNWPNWGGRGIRCEFASFQEFFAHVGPKPSLAHSIDRIDNDGNYTPGNVRWATRSEQMSNRRPYKHTYTRTVRPFKQTYTRTSEHSAKLTEARRRNAAAREGNFQWT
jgi:hypothetical protein